MGGIVLCTYQYHISYEIMKLKTLAKTRFGNDNQKINLESTWYPVKYIVSQNYGLKIHWWYNILEQLCDTTGHNTQNKIRLTKKQ